MGRRNLKTLVKAVLAAILIAVAALLSRAIEGRRVEEKLVVVSPWAEEVEALDVGAVAGTVLVGSFRVLIIDYLWIKFLESEREEEYHEILPLANHITNLQPNNTTTWGFLGDCIGKNLSVKPDDPEASWQWYRAGLEFLAKGARKNPESYILYSKLAELLNHVIKARSNSMTSAGITTGDYYRRKIAEGGLEEALAPELKALRSEYGPEFGRDERHLVLFFSRRTAELFDAGLGERYSPTYSRIIVGGWLAGAHVDMANLYYEKARKAGLAGDPAMVRTFSRAGLAHCDSLDDVLEKYFGDAEATGKYMECSKTGLTLTPQELRTRLEWLEKYEE